MKITHKHLRRIIKESIQLNLLSEVAIKDTEGNEIIVRTTTHNDRAGYIEFEGPGGRETYAVTAPDHGVRLRIDDVLPAKLEGFDTIKVKARAMQPVFTGEIEIPEVVDGAVIDDVLSPDIAKKIAGNYSSGADKFDIEGDLGKMTFTKANLA